MATILAVDDNPAGLDYLVTLLGYQGHHVLQANDGAEALELVHKEHPDLVLTDILMPTMDGFEFVRRLRSEPSVAGTPVIFYSASYHQREAFALAESCGVRYLICKPAQPEEILKTVNEALGSEAAPMLAAPAEEFDREHLRLLTNRLAREVNDLEAAITLQRALIDLGLRLASERDLPLLLDDFCRSARDLVGARYAVIGIMSENSQTLHYLFTSGMSPVITAAISTMAPREGVLGKLLVERGSLRLRCEGNEARLKGFPSDHPPVRSFLGLAISTPRQVYGWMYFADKLGADEFSAEDERLATTLAAQVAIAYENTRQFDELSRRTAKLEQEVAVRARLEAELRQGVSELRKADRHKDEFLAMLAHELRNPLAPILNALEVIRLGGSDAESIERAIEVAVRQVRHMARLIDDLLDVSRITRGTIQLRKELVELTTVVTHAVETSRSLFEASGHQLTLHLPSGPVRLEGDSVRLEQVLANLLNNAAKYTPPGGRITLSAEQEGAQVVLRVLDNGIGISAEMLPRVFDLFTQADCSLERTNGGLGIGLTLVRSLVEMHGGRVTVHSEGLGKGSEFIARLPALIDAPRRQPEAALEVSKVRPLQILVVDDHIDSARTLAKVLKLWGHHSRVAHSGQAALDEVAAASTDVVLLDIGLPGMDGYEVARRLRARPGAENLVIVALSGYGLEEDQLKSKAAGINQHLVKPVDLNDLRELLAHSESIKKVNPANNHYDNNA